MPIDTTASLVTAITDALYGEVVAGMTIAQRIRHHFRESTRTIARGLLRQERVIMTAEVDARRAMEKAVEKEHEARATAEQSADSAADALLGGI